MPAFCGAGLYSNVYGMTCTGSGIFRVLLGMFTFTFTAGTIANQTTCIRATDSAPCRTA